MSNNSAKKGTDNPRAVEASVESAAGLPCAAANAILHVAPASVAVALGVGVTKQQPITKYEK